MTRSLIQSSFEEAVKFIYKDRENIKNYLLNHPARNKFFDNMVKEITIAELSGKVDMTREKVIYLTKELTNTFIRAALLQVEKQEVNRLVEEAKKEKKMEETLAQDEEERIWYNKNKGI